MPFGRESVEDRFTRSRDACAGSILSPMPFGRESVEDAYGLENLVVRLSWSPMPFGRESVEDV